MKKNTPEQHRQTHFATAVNHSAAALLGGADQSLSLSSRRTSMSTTHRAIDMHTRQVERKIR